MSLKNSKNENIGDIYRYINEFKKGYQSRTDIMKEENSDLLADFYSILNRQKKYFGHMLNVHNIGEVTKTEMHTAEPLVTKPNYCKVELLLESWKDINQQVFIKFWQN
jgi:hypothetical protein